MNAILRFLLKVATVIFHGSAHPEKHLADLDENRTIIIMDWSRSIMERNPEIPWQHDRMFGDLYDTLARYLIDEFGATRQGVWYFEFPNDEEIIRFKLMYESDEDVAKRSRDIWQMNRKMKF